MDRELYELVRGILDEVIDLAMLDSLLDEDEEDATTGVVDVCLRIDAELLPGAREGHRSCSRRRSRRS